jgi:phosphoribosyl-ATP pyrophosphohydrolase
MLAELYQVLLDRKQQAPADSYTYALLSSGQEKILRKLHEETFELIQAANLEGDQRLVEESVDWLYHWLVLLVARGIPLDSIWRELHDRRGISGTTPEE